MRCQSTCLYLDVRPPLALPGWLRVARPVSNCQSSHCQLTVKALPGTQGYAKVRPMPFSQKLRHAVLGAPKSIKDPKAFHSVSLAALLAWVGLGADGLSSSAYGPDEAYRALGSHGGLAFFLAIATAITVFVISYGYSQIIEQFPSGGGGYVVTSKLLGQKVGVVAGSALLVDYILTIAISIAAGADAVFSFLPVQWQPYKLLVACAGLGVLTVMNLRGVRESILAIAPMFVLFLVTHVIVLLAMWLGHISDIPQLAHQIRSNVKQTTVELGTMGAILLFLRAYALGGGTYTGIEAVSNSMNMMREPKVVTAQRTMLLMAVSLALTAAGILLGYLLVHAVPIEGKTMNAVLVDAVAGHWTLAGFNVGTPFVIATLLSEAMLLFVAAQAGFLSGPRVMANMATDSWLPHRLSALSDRLTMRNGVVFMAAAAIAALLYVRGEVSKLVIMYSINVFVTFSLSNIAMIVYWVQHKETDRDWAKHLPAHVIAAVLCLGILGVTVFEKFAEGGWLTVLVTGLLTALCFVIKRHYHAVVCAIRKIDSDPANRLSRDFTPEQIVLRERKLLAQALDPNEPVAVLFVGGYGGLGRMALISLEKMFPGHFKGVVFVSVAVVDSDSFKGSKEVEALERRTIENLENYRKFAARQNIPSAYAYSIGAEVADEGVKLGAAEFQKYPKALVVAGQLIFEEDTAWNRVLHNETAFVIQRKLQHAGVPMIVLPVQLKI